MQKTQCLQKKWKEKEREMKEQAAIMIRRKRHKVLDIPQEKKELPDRKQKFTNFRKPISTPAERKDRNKYCRFHQDHGHRTNKCRNLKDQVETLIWQGKLQKYVKKT